MGDFYDKPLGMYRYNSIIYSDNNQPTQDKLYVIGGYNWNEAEIHR